MCTDKLTFEGRADSVGGMPLLDCDQEHREIGSFGTRRTLSRVPEKCPGTTQGHGRIWAGRRAGEPGHGRVGLGTKGTMSRHGGHGTARHDESMARQKHGTTKARQGHGTTKAWHDTARHSTARHDSRARHGTTWHDTGGGESQTNEFDLIFE